MCKNTKRSQISIETRVPWNSRIYIYKKKMKKIKHFANVFKFSICGVNFN